MHSREPPLGVEPRSRLYKSRVIAVIRRGRTGFPLVWSERRELNPLHASWEDAMRPLHFVRVDASPRLALRTHGLQPCALLLRQEALTCVLRVDKEVRRQDNPCRRDYHHQSPPYCCGNTRAFSERLHITTGLTVLPSRAFLPDSSV